MTESKLNDSTPRAREQSNASRLIEEEVLVNVVMSSTGRSYIFLDQLSSRGFVTFDGASGGVRLLLVVLSPLKSVFTRVRLHLGADTTPHLEHVHCHYTKIKGNSPPIVQFCTATCCPSGRSM